MTIGERRGGVDGLDEAARQELERSAAALVAELKAEQLAPEHMLLRIKDALADAGLRPAHGVESELPAGSAVYRDVIAWCIRVYYDGDGASGDGKRPG